ncbi:hypothetical protein ZWY2020_050564 [Hordeum vulgare]|nr:hypothetical protein ZWY2020_050564 [Hordeum vulgare]
MSESAHSMGALLDLMAVHSSPLPRFAGAPRGCAAPVAGAPGEGEEATPPAVPCLRAVVLGRRRGSGSPGKGRSGAADHGRRRRHRRAWACAGGIGGGRRTATVGIVSWAEERANKPMSCPKPAPAVP